MSNDNHIDYCRNLVREDDRERYECALFAPADVQPKLWALFAFNQEIAKTRENVSEAALGEIRLQWWRDVIEELRGGKTREHPVVEAMAATLVEKDVLDLLSLLVDAREQDLYDEGPADQKALEAYARAVGGTLNEVVLILSSDGEVGEGLRGLARDTGAAWAMLGLVRAIPFHWVSNRNYVPGDKGRASLATTDADKMYELAAPSIDQMIAFSQTHLEEVRKLRQHVHTGMRHVFLGNALLSLHLRALKKVGNNPFKAEEPASFRRFRKMFWYLVTGRF